MLSSSIIYFLGYIDGLGDAVEKGLVKAVGVSNYNGKSLWLLYVEVLNIVQNHFIIFIAF